MLNSQKFGVIKDQPNPYWSTLAAGPTSLTQPNESEFTAEPDLPNEELGPISKDKDKILHNQPQKDHGKKLSMFLQ